MEETRIVKGKESTIGVSLTEDTLSIEAIRRRLLASELAMLCGVIVREKKLVLEVITGYKVRVGMSGCADISFLRSSKINNIWINVCNIHVTMSGYCDNEMSIPLRYLPAVYRVLSKFYGETDIEILTPKLNFVNGIIFPEDIWEDKERGGDEIEIPAFDDEEEI